MDTTKPVTHVSLCAGYGGIDLGLKRAIPNLRTIAFSEIEAFACANLVAKMEAGWLDAAPVWTDVKTFPWEEFRGKVDILSGGYPCQPFSAAGKRLGKDDPRHLWPWIADGISILQPALCFFENVEGHISLGLSAVVSDLEGLGYKVAFGLFSASELGAPHQRKRIFVLAHRLCERGQLPDWWKFAAEQMPVSDGEARGNELAVAVQPRSQGSASEPMHTGRLQGAVGRGSYVAWPSRPGQPQFPWEPPRVVGNQPAGLGDAESERERGLPIGEGEAQPGFAGASSVGAGVGDAESQRSPAQRAKHEGLGGELCSASTSSKGVLGDTDCRGQSLGIDTGCSGQTIAGGQGNLEPSKRWQTEPALGGNADGPAGGMDYAKLCVSGDNRTDELRLLGNGVVPATAERAFRTLIARFFP